MKKRSLLIGIALLLFAVLACNFVAPQAEPTALPTRPQPTPQPQSAPVLQSENDVPRIEVAEAKAALDSGRATLVDVRSVESYARQHAAGALSIPLDRFETGIENISLEKDQWIITYCT